MSDWPQSPSLGSGPVGTTISTYGPAQPGSLYLSAIGIPGGGSGNLAANTAYFAWVAVPQTITVVKIGMENVIGGTGNVDFGIYDESFVRLVSTGSIAFPTGPFVGDIADTTIGPGGYYIAYAQSSASPTNRLNANANSLGDVRMFGWFSQAVFPLPSTATPSWGSSIQQQLALHTSTLVPL